MVKITKYRRACVAVRGIDVTSLWEVRTGDRKTVHVEVGEVDDESVDVFWDGNVSPPVGWSVRNKRISCCMRHHRY